MRYHSFFVVLFLVLLNFIESTIADAPDFVPAYNDAETTLLRERAERVYRRALLVFNRYFILKTIIQKCKIVSQYCCCRTAIIRGKTSMSAAFQHGQQWVPKGAVYKILLHKRSNIAVLHPLYIVLLNYFANNSKMQSYRLFEVL
jgi:hypothetical protein